MYPNYQPQPRGRVSRGIVALIIVLAVLVVALAVVIAMLVWPKPGPGASTNTTGGPTVTQTATQPATQTTTSEPPPIKEPTFLDGYRVLGTVMAAGTTEGQYGLIGATADEVIAYGGDHDAQPIAFDRATGAVLWQMYGYCGDLIAQKSLVCYVPKNYDPATGDAASWSFQWVDAATGQSQGPLDTSMLGKSTITTTETSQGELVLGAQVASADDIYNGTVNAVIGYYTGPGAPVWTLKAKESATTSEFYSAFDEGSGLFVWNVDGTVFVIDATTGTLVTQVQAYVAQVFSNRMVYLTTFDDTHQQPEQVVDVPGADPVTIRTAGNGDNAMKAYPGAAHPDVLLVGDDVGVSAHDPAAQFWDAPLWDHPYSNDWPSFTKLAWDGDRTAFAFGQNGLAFAFDVLTGQQLWTTSLTDAPDADFETSDVSVDYTSSVVLVQGYDYANDARVLTLLRADNGQPVTGIEGVSDLKDGMLLFGDASGEVQIAVPSF